jgi:hypothetical protein
MTPPRACGLSAALFLGLAAINPAAAAGLDRVQQARNLEAALASERAVAEAVGKRDTETLANVARSHREGRERQFASMSPGMLAGGRLGACLVAYTYIGMVAQFASEAIAADLSDDPLEKSYLQASRDALDPAARQYMEQVAQCEQALDRPRSSRSLPDPVLKVVQ